MFCEQLDVFLINEVRKSIRSCLQVVETAFFSFLNPLVCITVAVEDDSFMIFDGFLEKCMYCAFHLFFRNIFKSCAELGENFCNSSVQYDVRVCNGCCGTKHTEFEFVSGECKR